MSTSCLRHCHHYHPRISLGSFSYSLSLRRKDFCTYSFRLRPYPVSVSRTDHYRSRTTLFFILRFILLLDYFSYKNLTTRTLSYQITNPKEEPSRSLTRPRLIERNEPFRRGGSVPSVKTVPPDLFKRNRGRPNFDLRPICFTTSRVTTVWEFEVFIVISRGRREGSLLLFFCFDVTSNEGNLFVVCVRFLVSTGGETIIWAINVILRIRIFKFEPFHFNSSSSLDHLHGQGVYISGKRKLTRSHTIFEVR